MEGSYSFSILRNSHLQINVNQCTWVWELITSKKSLKGFRWIWSYSTTLNNTCRKTSWPITFIICYINIENYSTVSIIVISLADWGNTLAIKIILKWTLLKEYEHLYQDLEIGSFWITISISSLPYHTNQQKIWILKEYLLTWPLIKFVSAAIRETSFYPGLKSNKNLALREESPFSSRN